ncbi:MAG: TolC family protein [Acidobacteria bacterium]|nr:TolC family protein [Acidobacteriota bacterium]
MQTILCAMILAYAVLPPAMASAQQPPPPISLRDAVAISLEHNPQKKVALADTQLADARARIVRTSLLPNLFFNENITRGNDPVYVFGTRLRQQRFTQNDFSLNALNRPQPANDFVTRFSGSWTLFDSWKTERDIRTADLLAKSASAANTRSDQQLELQTVQAYEAVLFALRQADLADHNLLTAQAIQTSSINRFDAGLSVEADKIAASAYLAERQQEQIIAQGQVQIAWAELEAAIGTPIAPQRRHLLPLAEHQHPATPLDDAIATALHNRPDRTVLQLQDQADTSAIAAAKSAFGPQISTYGSWQMDRDSFAGSGGNDWVAGAELRLDLLPAAKRQELAMAKIGLRRAQASAAAADQQIRLDVTRAYYSLLAAQQALVVAKASSQQTAEGLRIANDRYQAGLATMTDLLRTEDQQRHSQTNYWQAVYSNDLHFADLQFATGTLTAESAGDIQ